MVNGGTNLSVRSDVKIAEYIKHITITKHDELFELEKQYCHVCQITTSLLINIKLPSQISKLILLEATRKCLSFYQTKYLLIILL